MKNKTILTLALSMLPILYNPKVRDTNTPEKNNIAIIINDMQREFLIKHDTTEINRELPNYIHVLEFAKNNNIPVIEIVYGNDTTNKTIDILKNIIQSLPIKKTINKNNDDGFEGTSLEKTLKEYNTKYILLAGVDEYACMYETGKTANSLGFKLLVSHDLTSNPKIVNHIHSTDASYYIADPEQYKEMYENYSIYGLTKNGGLHADDYRDLLKFIKIKSLNKIKK